MNATPRPLRALLLALLLSFVVVACGGSEEPAPPPEPAAPAAAPDPAPATVETAPTPELPATPPAPAAAPSPLLDPDSAAMTAQAPATYRVQFDTTKGQFIVEVTRAWAPRGADRFYNLVRHGYYDENRFFRVVSGFVVQFGVSGDPQLNRVWRDANIDDDPAVQGNTRGRLTFAHGGPDTRSSQLFINLGDNINLDLDFPAFGEVIDGLGVIDSLYAGYGDGPPYGPGPDQGRVQTEGNPYLEREFPQLDYIRSARVIAER